MTGELPRLVAARLLLGGRLRRRLGQRAPERQAAGQPAAARQRAVPAVPVRSDFAPADSSAMTPEPASVRRSRVARAVAQVAQAVARRCGGAGADAGAAAGGACFNAAIASAGCSAGVVSFGVIAATFAIA